MIGCACRLVGALAGQVFTRATARAVKQQLAPPRTPPSSQENGTYSSYAARNAPAGQPAPPQLIRPSIPSVPLDGSAPPYVATPTVGASRTAISVGPGPLPDGYSNGSAADSEKGSSYAQSTSKEEQ